VEISGYNLSGVADASVDVVYCTVVFMHLESWDRYNYILEAFRALRPGGRIYVDNSNLSAQMAAGKSSKLTAHSHPQTARPT
jgi:ubiquinone/menaquinone biosynthesis C-methylase UbiE